MPEEIECKPIMDAEEQHRLDKLNRKLLENIVHADPNLSLFQKDKYRAKAYKDHVWSNTVLKLGILAAGVISGLFTIQNGIKMWLGF